MALFRERGGLSAAFSDRRTFWIPSSEGPGPHTGCLPSRRGQTGPVSAEVEPAWFSFLVRR